MPVMQATLRQLGVPVIGDAEGVQLLEDGIHWSITSQAGVQRLVQPTVVQAATTKGLLPPEPSNATALAVHRSPLRGGGLGSAALQCRLHHYFSELLFPSPVVFFLNGGNGSFNSLIK